MPCIFYLTSFCSPSNAILSLSIAAAAFYFTSLPSPACLTFDFCSACKAACFSSSWALLSPLKVWQFYSTLIQTGFLYATVHCTLYTLVYNVSYILLVFYKMMSYLYGSIGQWSYMPGTEVYSTACACTVHTKIIFNSPQSSLILRYGLYLCNMYSVKYMYRWSCCTCSHVCFMYIQIYGT